MPDTLTCPNCGSPLPFAGAAFCMTCGAPVPEQPAAPVSAVAIPAGPAPLVAPAAAPIGQAKPGSLPSPARGARRPRFTVANPRNLFGLFDMVAIVALLAALAVTRLWPAPAACETLDVPAEHTIADGAAGQGGTLAGFVVFEAGKTYNIDEGQVLTVGRDATLLIQPGARLQFGRGAGLDVHGRLHACGSSARPIVLTSALDDPKRGSKPQPGDWAGIRFYDDSDDGSVLGHVQVRYAGRENQAPVHLTAAAPTFVELTVADAKWAPISVDANSMPRMSGTIDFRNVALRGIEVRGGRMVQDVTWEDHGAVYVVAATVTVGEGARLTVKPGVTVKFADDSGLEVEGVLLAAGNSRTAPQLGDKAAVTFTSLADDEAAGDTDLRAAVARQGAWNGILFRGGGARSSLHGAIIRFAGKNHRAAVHVENVSPEITANRIEQGGWYAVSIDATSAPRINGNALAKIAEGTGLEVRGGSLESRDTVRWQAASSDMVRVMTGPLSVGRDTVLEIGPGLVVRFAPGAGIAVNGALRVLGESGKRVVLTSLKDRVGDAGGSIDAGAAGPAAGDWDGIRFNRGSNDKISQVQFATLRYAGSALRLADVSPAIDDVEITFTTGYGITCEGSARLSGSKVTFSQAAQGNTNCK